MQSEMWLVGSHTSQSADLIWPQLLDLTSITFPVDNLHTVSTSHFRTLFIAQLFVSEQCSYLKWRGCCVAQKSADLFYSVVGPNLKHVYWRQLGIPAIQKQSCFFVVGRFCLCYGEVIQLSSASADLLCSIALWPASYTRISFRPKHCYSIFVASICLAVLVFCYCTLYWEIRITPLSGVILPDWS